MELGSIGLGLVREGVTGCPVPDATEFWIPPAGDPRRASGRGKKVMNYAKHTPQANVLMVKK